MRPNTLAVATKHRKSMDTRKFISEALHVWRAKARGNIVPAERLHELLEELKFNPTEKQINEMLQTAKLFARRGGNSLDVRNSSNSLRHMNGLTFGEFCVLAADLKRFRIQCGPVSVVTNNSNDLSQADGSSLSDRTDISSKKCDQFESEATCSAATSVKHELKPTDGCAPEVFLGGSCNPTTWRADVAIPTLNKLGISFYNPQVSDWTPDLIELEHRAKEKARVLFFVMDSETRASAGAIEAAHIAGQNAQHLVVVLHPYKPEQCILNEPISAQEFLDLKRNQQLLRELVTRRGLPVLDSIPSGLQQTRAILAGSNGFTHPHNIASRLIAVRRAFDRVLDKKILCSGNERISLRQCQSALNILGYAQNLLFIDSLSDIVLSNRELCVTTDSKSQNVDKSSSGAITIDFEEFCMLTSYLTILQQEISESGCISPIKGTNLPPPPIFLTNAPEWVHNHQGILNDGTIAVLSSTSYSKQMYRSGSAKNVPDDRTNLTTYTTVVTDTYRNRDSGTSSPQPSENRSSTTLNSIGSCGTPSASTSTPANDDNISKSPSNDGKTKISLNVEYFALKKQHQEEIIVDDADEELSDSNDSVFSSGSSIDSILNFSNPDHFSVDQRNGTDLRDIYLGGSCMLRTTWRDNIVIPMLKEQNITFRLPQLHESIIHEHNSLSDSEKFDIYGSSHSDAIGSNDSGICTSSKKKSPRMRLITGYSTTQESETVNGITTSTIQHSILRRNMFNPELLESSRVLLFIITNETRSLAPMTLAAHCIGLGFNVVLCVQMLSNDCVIGQDRLTPAAVKDYNRGRAYLIDLAKRQDVPVFNDLKQTVQCAIEKVKMYKCPNSV